MQRTFFNPLSILLLLAMTTTSGAGDPIRLRVLSYNIHHAEGMDRQLNVERIARVISSVEPDLVALQEVDKVVERTQSVDQPNELARLTKMHVVFGANIELEGGHYGNAVLSRFPIVQHKNYLLPNVDESEQRGLLETEVAISESQALRLWATHLDFRPDDRERLASAKAINDRIATHADQPAILAGDLNDTPGSETLAEFQKMWTQSNETPLATTPVDRPTKQIDFILYRPQNRWRVIDVQVLQETVASDHRAILAILELLPSQDP